jgi:ribosomal protein L18
LAIADYGDTIGNWQSEIGNKKMANTSRAIVREAIHRRIRRKVKGSGERPRLAVYRSLNHIYAQVVDDERGQTNRFRVDHRKGSTWFHWRQSRRGAAALAKRLPNAQ